MITIQKKDGSWIKFSCPEWNYLSAAQQKDILKKLSEWPTNVVPFKRKTEIQNIQIG